MVGLFAPPLLLRPRSAPRIGAGMGALVKRHDEKEMGVDLEQYLPPGTSASRRRRQRRLRRHVEKSLLKADKKINKAIDSGDVDKLQTALDDAGYDIDDAINS